MDRATLLSLHLRLDCVPRHDPRRRAQEEKIAQMFCYVGNHMRTVCEGSSRDCTNLHKYI